MTSQEIYIEVCRLYFRENYSREEIIEILSFNLLDYVHETTNCIYKMSNEMTVVNTIIMNEIESHAQSKYF
jgi:hypothetical protein